MRQCRERYKYYLHPQILNAPWKEYEDHLLRAKFAEMGPQWTKMTVFFDSRSPANLKNRWAMLCTRDRSDPARIVQTPLTEDVTSDSSIAAPTEPVGQSNVACPEHKELMPLYGIELTADDWDSEESQRYRWELRRCFPGHFGDHW
jgi:hypothetical protein